MTSPVTPQAPCPHCAALEAWILKALRLFDRMREECTTIPWLARQIARAREQCPIAAPAAQEEP